MGGGACDGRWGNKNEDAGGINVMDVRENGENCIINGVNCRIAVKIPYVSKTSLPVQQSFFRQFTLAFYNLHTQPCTANSLISNSAHQTKSSG